MYGDRWLLVFWFRSFPGTERTHCNGNLTPVTESMISLMSTKFQEHICCIKLCLFVWVINVCAYYFL